MTVEIEKRHGEADVSAWTRALGAEGATILGKLVEDRFFEIVPQGLRVTILSKAAQAPQEPGRVRGPAAPSSRTVKPSETPAGRRERNDRADFDARRGATFARVPCVSADAARHQIRETGAKIQLAIQTLDRGGALSEAALRLLFAGGMVTGDGDAGSVKMGEYRHLRDMVPILGLLGGCAMNRTIPGRTQVDDLTLVCAETAHYLPAWVREVEEVATMMGQSWRAAVEEPQRVRMDPSLSPTLRHLLDDGSRAQIEARLDRSEKASAEGDAVGKDAAKSTMMPRRFQRIAQGSLFVWGLIASAA
jgi:hypothetical protein